MPGLKTVIVRGPVSVGTARFVRDVTASVVAAGLATLAFSHLAHERTAPAGPASQPKIQDRVAWELEEVPTRVTRTYDSIAMFGLPLIEAKAWSEPSARPEPKPDAVARTIPAARPEAPARRLAALPPGRPAALAAGAPAVRPEPAGAVTLAEAATPKRGGLTVLGWDLPGTDLIPAILPDGRAVLKRIVSVGDDVVGAGSALAETIGLK